MEFKISVHGNECFPVTLTFLMGSLKQILKRTFLKLANDNNVECLQIYEYQSSNQDMCQNSTTVFSVSISVSTKHRHYSPVHLWDYQFMLCQHKNCCHKPYLIIHNDTFLLHMDRIPLTVHYFHLTW